MFFFHFSSLLSTTLTLSSLPTWRARVKMTDSALPRTQLLYLHHLRPKKRSVFSRGETKATSVALVPVNCVAPRTTRQDATRLPAARRDPRLCPDCSMGELFFSFLSAYFGFSPLSVIGNCPDLVFRLRSLKFIAMLNVAGWSWTSSSFDLNDPDRLALKPCWRRSDESRLICICRQANYCRGAIH